jgi:hypothetical protein
MIISTHSLMTSSLAYRPEPLNDRATYIQLLDTEKVDISETLECKFFRTNAEPIWVSGR